MISTFLYNSSSTFFGCFLLTIFLNFGNLLTFIFSKYPCPLCSAVSVNVGRTFLFSSSPLCPTSSFKLYPDSSPIPLVLFGSWILGMILTSACPSPSSLCSLRDSNLLSSIGYSWSWFSSSPETSRASTGLRRDRSTPDDSPEFSSWFGFTSKEI